MYIYVYVKILVWGKKNNPVNHGCKGVKSYNTNAHCKHAYKERNKTRMGIYTCSQTNLDLCMYCQDSLTTTTARFMHGLNKIGQMMTTDTVTPIISSTPTFFLDELWAFSLCLIIRFARAGFCWFHFSQRDSSVLATRPHGLCDCDPSNRHRRWWRRRCGKMKRLSGSLSGFCRVSGGGGTCDGDSCSCSR